MKKLISLFVMTLITLSINASEKKTVVVTGGAGFIGSNFVKYMYDKCEDYDLIVLDALTYSASIDNIPEYIQKSPRFKFVHGSICDKELVDTVFKNANFVVHFAAETDVTRSIYDDEVFFETNVMGTRTLLHALVKHKNIERFIQISSSEVYGTCENEDIDENHPLNPRSPYAAAKAGADRAVYAYGCTYDVPVVILRFFNNYGPAQHLEKVVGKFITLAINKEPLTVHGSGDQLRDWIYVVDTARAVDAALHVENFDLIKNQVINCGTGRAISILDIAKVVLNYFHLPEEQYLHYSSDRPGQVEKHLSSTEKAFNLLGWKATTSFEDGLTDTIRWYEAHPEFWEKMFLSSEIRKENKTLIQEKLNLSSL